MKKEKKQNQSTNKSCSKNNIKNNLNKDSKSKNLGFENEAKSFELDENNEHSFEIK